MAKQVTDFEVIDHGIFTPSLFPGCSVAFTPYSQGVTGSGVNPADAIDNCRFHLLKGGVDIDDLRDRILAKYGLTHLPEYPVTRSTRKAYYVTIQFNL